MNSNFDLASLALKSVCPSNELLYDDKGMPSVMVRIPKMTYAQLGMGESTAIHPAFIINGQEVDAVWISKYQNVVNNGRAYSLPGEDPKVNINFDTAVNVCTAKGEGWHLMTRAEWALIAQWCLNNGFLPYGNNNYGKDSRESNYKAIPTYKYEDNGVERIGRVATGTGPLEWSHDKTLNGIWDLNGNVWEWVGGIRLVYGELQVLINNNAADLDNPQSASSVLWKAIDGTTGEYITPNGSGTTANSLKLDWVSGAWKWVTGTLTGQSNESRYCAYENVTCDETVCADAKFTLQSLALFRHNDTSGVYEGDYVWANNGAPERGFFAGGSWYNGVQSGVFALSGDSARSHSGGGVGFRSAYVKLPTA